MLATLDKTALKSFLKESKILIKRKRRTIIPRDYDINGEKVYYIQAILDIGLLSKEQIWDYIIDLKEEECFRISNDYDLSRDFNSEMFEFIKIINGKRVYIKLTLKGGENDKILCLSFHESNRIEESVV